MDGQVGQTATEIQIATQMRSSAATARAQGNVAWAAQLELWASQLENDPMSGAGYAAYGPGYQPSYQYPPTYPFYNYPTTYYSLFHPIETFVPLFSSGTLTVSTTTR